MYYVSMRLENAIVRNTKSALQSYTALCNIAQSPHTFLKMSCFLATAAQLRQHVDAAGCRTCLAD